jgi:GNAT superfamily N-acetyltransferase
MTPRFGVRVATAADGPGLVALFEAAASPCFCRFWHFAGDKNEWLSRCYVEVGTNRRELEVDLGRGAPEAHGLVAFEPPVGAGGAPRLVGWLKVAPAAVMTKAYDQRLYRGLPCFAGDRAGVFLLGCSLVHPDLRRQGVLRALVRAAKALAPTWGASALEVLPRRPREPVSDEELWVGPAALFLAEGFEEVHAFEPYPVLRWTAPAATPS